MNKKSYLARKYINAIINENSCEVMTVLVGDDRYYPHEYDYLETKVEIINIFGALGLKEIEVYIDDFFYCKHCLERKRILREEINLMNYPNWIEELKKITNKYGGNINVTNISERSKKRTKRIGERHSKHKKCDEVDGKK